MFVTSDPVEALRVVEVAQRFSLHVTVECRDGGRFALEIPNGDALLLLAIAHTLREAHRLPTWPVVSETFHLLLQEEARA
jgi:hypothetical protein